FSRLPRAFQWALVAVAGIVLFMAWDRYLHPISDQWARSADGLQGRVNEIRQAGEIADKFRSPEIHDAVIGLGPVAPPDGGPLVPSLAEGTTELNNAVTDVLKKHKVDKDNFDVRPRGKLPSGALAAG